MVPVVLALNDLLSTALASATAVFHKRTGSSQLDLLWLL
jgi:hypothetical protein